MAGVELLPGLSEGFQLSLAQLHPIHALSGRSGAVGSKSGPLCPDAPQVSEGEAPGEVL